MNNKNSSDSNSNNSTPFASWLRQPDIDALHKFMTNGDELEEALKYNLFVSAHLSESKQELAEMECRHFRNVLDREIMGRGNRLYKLLFVEEGEHAFSVSYNQRHAHWLIQQPNHLTLNQFRNEFVRTWKDVCGSSNVIIKPVENEAGGLVGLLNYLTKERDANGTPGFSSFVEASSDNAFLQKHRQGCRQPEIIMGSTL